jgi:DNA-binding GntR family transcriptional regulator
MQSNVVVPLRRTSADLIYAQLYDQIVSLELMPGAKLSEADVADQFGVSRQPVREAFNRLGNMGLLLIQPQKATLVQRFSMAGISAARFIRLAVELEVARVACQKWSETLRSVFEANLDAQQKAVDAGEFKRFHSLDEEFHSLIADAAEVPFAFELVLEKKAHVDRICVLSLKQEQEMQIIFEDHSLIFECLSTGKQDELEVAMRTHLGRLEKTIHAVRRSHEAYFDD